MKVASPQDQRPFAYADRRSLSRAWFDALYARFAQPRTGRAPLAQAPAPSEGDLPPAGPRDEPCANAASLPAGDAPNLARSPRTQAVQLCSLTSGVERTGAPDAARRREVRLAAATPQRPQPVLDVALHAADGTALRLLLDGHGDRVRVVAIGDSASLARTADALARARLVLASRGISLHSRLLESR